MKFIKKFIVIYNKHSIINKIQFYDNYENNNPNFIHYIGFNIYPKQLYFIIKNKDIILNLIIRQNKI